MSKQSKSQCSYCQKWYSTKTNVNKHLKKIHKIQWDEGVEKPFTCAYCNKKYSYRKVLIEHMRKKHEIHIGKRIKNGNSSINVKCCTCGKRFVTIRLLRQHISSVHLINIEHIEKTFRTKEGKPYCVHMYAVCIQYYYSIIYYTVYTLYVCTLYIHTYLIYFHICT